MHIESLLLSSVVVAACVGLAAGVLGADPPDFAAPVCAAPAVTGLKVTNDRWPDASSPLQFGLDAIRLEDAKTDQEKAIALWLWVRRFTMYTNGTPPTERVASGRGYVSDPMKILNVWGAHWCDGLSRCMELSWRHLGYPAQKFYKAGHTLCDAYWVDDDGVGRYHVFDVSEGWFAFTRDGSRLATAEEIARDSSLVHRPAVGPLLRHESSHSIWGWVHATHLPFEQTHKMELQMRPGESFVRHWGNVGKPFQDNVGRKGDNVPAEHGPHPVDYGNGVWEFRVPLTADGMRAQTCRPPQNCRFGEGGSFVEQADPTKPAELVFRVVSPYIISSLTVEAVCGGELAVEVSDDNGRTWRAIEPVDGQTPRRPSELARRQFELAPPAADGEETSAFGRYDVLVRLSLKSGRLFELKFRTTVQHNIYSLPQLLPGHNKITIHGNLAEGYAARVTFEWEEGSGTWKNVAIADKLPLTYDIPVGGRRWGDVRCTSLLVETVPISHELFAVFTPNSAKTLPPGRPNFVPGTMAPLADYFVSLGTRQDRPPRAVPPLGPLDDYLKALSDPEAKKADLHAALAAIRVIGDANAYDAVRAVAMANLDLPKMQALQTMYWLDRARATNEFLAILREQCPDIRYKQDDANPAVRGGHYFAVAAQVSRFLADERIADAVPPLIKALGADAKAGLWDEPQRAIIRSLGELGDRSAVPVLLRFAAGSVDDAEVAVEALGRLGDPAAISVIRRTVASGYTPLRREAIIALGRLNDRDSEAMFVRRLSDADADARAASAEALAAIAARGSLPALQERLASEPVEFVRRAIRRSMAALSADRRAGRPADYDNTPLGAAYDTADKVARLRDEHLRNWMGEWLELRDKYLELWREHGPDGEQVVRIRNRMVTHSAVIADRATQLLAMGQPLE